MLGKITGNAAASLFLFAPDLSALTVDTTTANENTRFAQMDSPGDGLDKNAASEGNGRPSRVKGSKSKNSSMSKRKRL